MSGESGQSTGSGSSGEPGAISKEKLALGGAFLIPVIGLLVFLGFRFQWSFSDSIGVASMVVSVLGFGIAILEIKRARSVSVATRQAVDATLSRVETARLQVTITEMLGLVTTIEDACDQGEMKAFRDASRRWRTLAGSAIALISQRSNDEDRVVELIEDARRLGREANQTAHEEGESLRTVAKDFLAAMAEVADVLALVAEDLLSTIEPLNEH